MAGQILDNVGQNAIPGQNENSPGQIEKPVK
jgi:hypothetical protein